MMNNHSASPYNKRLRQMSGQSRSHIKSGVNRLQSQEVGHSQNIPGDPPLDILGVKPYEKKYINGIPGSSPIVRSGADDLAYQQRYGKGPLIERAERLRRLQELKANMATKPIDDPNDTGIKVVRDTRKHSNRQSAKKRQPSARADVIHRHDEANVRALYQDNSLPTIQVQSPAGAEYSKHHPQQTPLQGGRFVKPPLHQVYGPSSRNSQISEAQSRPLARAYSKDYLNQGSQLRSNRYAGAASIVEAGRVESQRLLMERYRRIDIGGDAQADTRQQSALKQAPPKFISGGGYH